MTEIRETCVLLLQCMLHMYYEGVEGLVDGKLPTKAAKLHPNV